MVQVDSPGEFMQIGEIDSRCVSNTNELPKLTQRQAETQTWKPDSRLWDRIKDLSLETPAQVEIRGLLRGREVSYGQVRFTTAKERVGAPVFYRDVPLMPSELKKGEIKPLEPKLLPYVAWRLRDIGEPKSRVLMEGLHTCANCHSFSNDGKTLGMDLDGPHNDKGLYAIVPIAQHTSIEEKNVISWKSFRGQMESNKRIGFMSQVSPDGRYVITATQVQYFVANFKDYRFLQVFYPTRGILAWYDREDGVVRSLPGADDPKYVQVNAVWSPDGQYLVFARAKAMDPYPANGKLPEYPNDPNEPQIQYDLYRIPFNNGKGGKPEPIEGASRNGMSNSFPKISPDGKWIVFVQCKNGQLMRPDGKLYMVPAEGGKARKMNCNTPLMNSWHSFSPNGRWMVFSSKSRSPFTQMFLTYIDEEAIQVWNEALKLDPEDAKSHNNLGALFLGQGKLEEAATHFEKAIDRDSELFNAHDNLGLVRLHQGKIRDAISHFQTALSIEFESTETHVNLGGAYLMLGDYREALNQLDEALRLEPNRIPILNNMAWILATSPDPEIRDGKKAVEFAEKAARLSKRSSVIVLDTLGASYAEVGRFKKAIETTRQAMELADQSRDRRIADLKTRISLYESGRAYREK
jgi:tetratricopeptide (TPR) repeat protein